MKRTLTLNAERLNDLTPGELGAVNAAGSYATVACISGACVRVSQLAISLCGCLTSYCSIDVC